MKRKKFLRNALLGVGIGALKSNKLFASVHAGIEKLFTNNVKFLWSGALTSDSVRINAKMTNVSTAVRLVISTDSNLQNPVYGPVVSVSPSTNMMAKLSQAGLLPDTKYYYGIESDGVLDTAPTAIGSFKTTKNGPLSFNFTAGSCIGNASHPIFNRIAEKNPLLHIVHGDFHYDDPNSDTDINVHRAPYENRMTKPLLASLFQNCSFVYTWDDHDFSGDDSWVISPGRTNARLAYQEYIPHYPLVEGSGNVPIYQGFTVGRVRFLLTDLRSERTPDTMMGTAQKQWFKNECIAAKNRGQLIIMISSVPWGGVGGDSWGALANERKELSDFFKNNQIKNLLIICGDAHMIGIDDGTNHDFSTGSNNPHKYPVFQAGALTVGGSYKGGTFSHGMFLNPDHFNGQYGLVQITDHGGDITATLNGFRVDNYGNEVPLLTVSFTFSTSVTLPIKIVSFNAVATHEDKTMLTWLIDDAANCKSVIIERSSNGVDFSAIGSLPCQGINGSFVDHTPLHGVNYYRLKIVEQDNRVNYSGVKFLRFEKNNTVEILGNPVYNSMKVRVGVHKREKTVYILSDGSGRQLYQNHIYLNEGINTLHVPTEDLAAGTYFFNIFLHGTTVVRKFVKS